MSESRERILLVDDDEGFRYATTKALEEAGFAVSSAPDYRQALEILEGDLPVDLLVTDVYMPERIHGFALARMAKMRRLGLKVLYVSAFDVPSVEEFGKVLRKPISNEHLIDEVRLALAG
jgi:CheY-like chemotaxis protein